MNFYNEIKNEIIDIETYKKVKDYSKNKRELEGYYKIGKLLVDAQGGEEKAKYGDNLIKEYSKKLMKELGKKYGTRYLFDIRKLYFFSKVHPLDAQLTMSHYRLLFSITNSNKINYYIKQIKKYNLSKRQLQEKIKSKEYERLDEKTKQKLIKNKKEEIKDFIKHPIIIRNINSYKEISEKLLQKLILEDKPSFIKE
jgi:predicted nuclease of restriction endonuclease-like (RecB) superfamily